MRGRPLLVLGLALLLAGCGQDLRKENEQLKAQVGLLQKANGDLKGQMVQVQGETAALRKELEEVRKELEALSQKVQELTAKPAPKGARAPRKP